MCTFIKPADMKARAKRRVTAGKLVGAITCGSFGQCWGAGLALLPLALPAPIGNLDSEPLGQGLDAVGDCLP